MAGTVNMKKVSLVLLISSICLVGCSTHNPKNELAQFSAKGTQSTVADVQSSSESFSALKTTRARNIISPGFELDLNVIEDQNLNGKFRVAFDGNLELPYNVRVKAVDLTTTQLESKIQEAYAQFFRNPPTVQVKIVDHSYYVDVRGLVDEPGQYLVKRDSSLDEVLAQAGGLQRVGQDGQSARYVRFDQLNQTRILRLTDYYAGMPSGAIEWMGGDIVFFQSERDGALTAEHDGRAGYLQILGQVREPGEYQVVNNLSFYDYLARAGGPTNQANLKKIEIVRRNSQGQKSVTFNLNETEQHPELESGDLVMVHSQDPNVVIPNVTGIIGSIATVIFAAFAI